MKRKIFLVPFILFLLYGCDSNVLEPSDTQSFYVFNVQNRNHVTLEVINSYDVKIRTLVDDDLDPGLYVTYWDHENEKGKKVREGLYYFRLKVNNNIVDQLDLFLFNP